MGERHHHKKGEHQSGSGHGRSSNPPVTGTSRTRTERSVTPDLDWDPLERNTRERSPQRRPSTPPSQQNPSSSSMYYPEQSSSIIASNEPFPSSFINYNNGAPAATVDPRDLRRLSLPSSSASYRAYSSTGSQNQAPPPSATPSAMPAPKPSSKSTDSTQKQQDGGKTKSSTRYLCKYCGQGFRSSVHRNNHYKKCDKNPANKKIEECPICHQKKVKPDHRCVERTFRCSECGDYMQTKAGLELHQKACKKDFCWMCRATFDTEKKLQEHKKKCKTAETPKKLPNIFHG